MKNSFMSYDFTALNKELKKGQVKACIIMSDDTTVFEYYKNQKAKTATHPIHSCTKSITSILIGMCLEDGLIKDIHTPLIDFFPDLLLNQKDVRKQNLTLYHLLTMTPGFHWPEFGEWNFGTPMEFSKDMIRFIFEREIDTEPGTKMIYNSGCSNILSAIIGKVTDSKAADFAYKRLFSPLGINDFIWNEKQNISLGANGLRMKASDMLKIGSLYLHNGKIKETQLISADWISESTKPRFITYTDIGHYGYHWWTSTLSLGDKQEISYYFAMGLFGQFIIVVPCFDIVAIFISENYGDSLKPMRYFRELVAPIFQGE